MISLDELLEDKETRDLIIEKLKKYGFRINLIADYYIYELIKGKQVFKDVAYTEAFADYKINKAMKDNPKRIYIKKYVKVNDNKRWGRNEMP